MDKQLIPYKNTVFNKIKLFFRNIFKKKDIVPTTESEKIDLPPNNKIDFEQTIKVDSNEINQVYKKMEIEDFIDDLEKHPEKLKNLSTDRLLTLEKYVNKELKEYNEKIEKLKNAS